MMTEMNAKNLGFAMICQQILHGCNTLSQHLSKFSGLAALALFSEWPLDGMLVRIACAMDNTALAVASVELLWISRAESLRALLAIWSCTSCWAWLWNSLCKKGPFGPRDS